MILSTARSLFSELGVEATSVDAIAARAELAKGTIYLYFKSKDEIQLALLEEDLAKLRSAAVQLLDQAPSAQTALEMLQHAALVFYRSRPLGFLSLVRMQGRSLDTFLQERLATQREAMIDVLAQLVRRGQERGEIRSDHNAVSVAWMLWANFIGTILLYESGGISDLEAQFHDMYAIIRTGLAT